MHIIQEKLQREAVCPDGNCPPDIDLVKEIALTPLERKAIFFCLKKNIDKLKASLPE